MVNKKIIIGLSVILSVAIIGAAAAVGIAASSKSKADPNLKMYVNDEKLGENGSISIVKEGEGKDIPKMVADYKSSTGKDLEAVKYEASDGTAYSILIPPGLKSQVGKAMEEIERRISTQKLMKERLERTPTEQAKAIEAIQNLFGDSDVVYNSVSGNPYTKENARENYSDGSGRTFIFDIASNKVVRLQVGGDKWCARQDILDSECHFIEGKLTEDEARAKASTFLVKALGSEKAEEVISNVGLQRVPDKGNTFLFMYPEGAGTLEKDYQLLVVIEPVSGEVVNYQNYLK